MYRLSRNTYFYMKNRIFSFVQSSDGLRKKGHFIDFILNPLWDMLQFHWIKFMQPKYLPLKCHQNQFQFVFSFSKLAKHKDTARCEPSILKIFLFNVKTLTVSKAKEEHNLITKACIAQSLYKIMTKQCHASVLTHKIMIIVLHEQI